MEVWLTVAQVAKITGLPERTARDHAVRGRFSSVTVEQGTRGHSGKRYLIGLSSLAPEVQARWHTQQVARPEPQSTPSVTDQTVLDLVRLQERHGDAELAKTVDRMNIAKQALSLEGAERSSFIDERARSLGVHSRSVRRWIERYEKKGLIGVADGTKMREGGGYGSRYLPPEAIKFIEGLRLLKPPRTGLWCMSVYKQLAPGKGWPLVSKATFYRILKEVPPTLVQFAQDPKKWDHTFRPAAVRTSEGLRVNEEWVFDHHELDFWAEYDGRAIRPALTAIVDWATRCLVGYAFAVTPSSNSISAALSSAIYPKEDLPFQGVPDRAYMDNGKDFRSHRISGTEEKVRVDCGPALMGVMEVLQIETHFALPYNAESKAVIERFFGDVARMWSRYQDSWCGSNDDERPSELTSAEIKRMLKAGLLPHFEDLAEMFKAQFLIPYLNMPSESEALRGKSRLEAYMTYPRAGKVVPTVRVAPLLFGKGDIATVTRRGIRKFGPDYWFWSEELAPYIGKRVVVRWDPNDISTLYVFDKARFVCAVQNRDLLALRATEEDVSNWAKEQARVRKHIREEVVARRRSVADIVAEANQAGPSVVTLPMAVNASTGRVTMLTPFETAARARPQPNGGQAGPASAKSRDLADEFLLALGDQALLEMAQRRVK